MILPAPTTPSHSQRALRVFWLVDCSGSMRLGGKMEALNEAARQALPFWRSTAQAYPQAAVSSRLLQFSDEASWASEAPVAVEDFVWPDLAAQGATALGAALELLGDDLAQATPPAYPPLVILITDGLPTDEVPSGLQKLFATEAGARAHRFVVAIGRDAATPEAFEHFRAFLGLEGTMPLLAHYAGALQAQLRLLATAGLRSVVDPEVGIPGAAVATFPVVPANLAEASSGEQW